MLICERIKLLCTERGLSMYRVEKECGFSNGSIMKWEKSSPKVENIVKLADYFGVTLDYLVGRNFPKENDIIERSNFALSTELAELSTDRDFVASAKLYKAVDNECKKQICAYILGVASALGVNIAQILGK